MTVFCFSNILTRTAEYRCIVHNLEIFTEPPFIAIFVSIAYQVLSGCSSGHVVVTWNKKAGKFF